jgi:hypothetical protein
VSAGFASREENQSYAGPESEVYDKEEQRDAILFCFRGLIRQHDELQWDQCEIDGQEDQPNPYVWMARSGFQEAHALTS